MTVWLSDLAGVLRRAGLDVVEVDGWRTRSYPTWTPGYQQAPNHVMCHHTASNASPANDLQYILHGPISPIANLYLARDGTFHVVAAGQVATNGAGAAPWDQVPNDQMNHYAISIEAANTGVGEPWPAVQTDAYVAGVAALCLEYAIPVDHVRSHHEWAPTRKIDPAGPSPWATGTRTWDMDAFRADVTRQLDAAYTPPPIPQPDEEDTMLTARRYQDRRFQNVWLIGAGSPVHLTPALAGNYAAAGVELVTDVHDQMLHTLLFQCGLTANDLVAV